MAFRIILSLVLVSIAVGMLSEEKAQLRLKVLEMFKHGFGSYMVNKRLTDSPNIVSIFRNMPSLPMN